MRRDDRDDPFDEFFEEIERMMNDMMRDANVHVERGVEDAGGTTADVHLDVHQTDDQLRVVADLPGIDKEAIDLKCDGEVLTIEASGDEREYHERVTLPTRVNEHTANATYNNGVLEVSFDTASDSADIDLS